MLTVKYTGDTEEETLQVSFLVLKKDLPLELARYIRDKVVEDSRRGHYNTWAKKVIKNHGRTIQRIQRYYTPITVTTRLQGDPLLGYLGLSTPHQLFGVPSANPACRHQPSEQNSPP